MTESTTWWEATFEFAEDLSDEIGAILIESGALGVQTISEEIPLPSLPDIHGNPPETLELDIEAGHNLLIASFAPDRTPDQIRQIIERCHTELGAANIRKLDISHKDDNSWQTMWKAFFTPRQLGKRFWVVPSWEEDFVTPDDTHAIVIDPGMAFGTGHHATTALCLEALEQVMNQGPVSSLLDVGCGSGILSIGAGMLGAENIDAIDVDPKAVEVTQENSIINKLNNIQASTTPIQEISKQYNVVVANILANILIRLAPGIVQTVGDSSTLILSGIPFHQIEEVQETFNKAHEEKWGRQLPVPTLTQEGEWACLVYNNADCEEALC